MSSSWMRAFGEVGSGCSYWSSALIVCSLSLALVGCRLIAHRALSGSKARSLRAQPTTDNAPQAQLIVALVLLLVGRQRWIFERDFFAGLQAFHDFDMGVVGETGHDRALLEELLPGVFVGCLPILFHFLRGDGVRVELLLHEDQLDAVALKDRLDGDGEHFVFALAVDLDVGGHAGAQLAALGIETDLDVENAHFVVDANSRGDT